MHPILRRHLAIHLEVVESPIEVHEDKEDLPDPQALKAIQVTMAHKDLQARLDCMVKEAPQEHEETPDHQDRQDRLDHQGHPAQQVPMRQE